MYYLFGLIIILGGAIMMMKRSKGKPITELLPEQNKESRQIAGNCCGAHEICEFDDLAFNPEEIIYFNDEELDELRNLREDQFTNRQMDDLREVLYTLRTNEISQWLISMSKRHIHIPAILQQEARQLMSEK